MLSLPDIESENPVVLEALLTLARVSPEKSYEFVKRAGKYGHKWAMPIFEIWMAKDPEAAMMNMGSLIPKEEEKIKNLTILAEIAPMAAIDWLMLNETGFLDVDMERLARLVRHNPRKLADAILSQGYAKIENGKRNTLMSVMVEWALIKPKEVTNYLAQLPSNDREHFALHTLQTRAIKDPRGNYNHEWKLPIIAALDDGVAKRKINEEVIVAIAKNNPEYAFKLAEETGIPEVMDATISATIEYISNSDILKALTLVDEIKDDKQRAKAYNNALNGWATSKPEEALPWLWDNRNNNISEKALFSAAKNLTIRDPAAVVEWLNSTEANGSNKATINDALAMRLRQVGAHWIGSTLAEKNSIPDGARIISTIKDTSARQEALRSASIFWLFMQPDKGLEFINSSELSVDSKQKIIREVQVMRGQ